MFNKQGFDTGLYNRIAESITAEIYASLLGIGAQSTNARIVIQMESSLTGVGGTVGGAMVVKTPLSNVVLASQGTMGISYLVFFFLSLTPALTSSGTLALGMSILTPLPLAFTGSGGVTLQENIIKQQMVSSMTSAGTLSGTTNLSTDLGSVLFSGSGALVYTGTGVLLHLSSGFVGSGTMKLRRIGSTKELVLELEGIVLPSNATVIIDTDLLTVIVNGLHDVSGVTSESIFFELPPGEIELMVEMTPTSTMLATVIWQNRWL